MINRRSFFKSTATAGAVLAVGSLATSAVAMTKDVTSSGTFQGRSNHITTGGVSLYKEGDQYFVELADDFSLDGGPDPRVGFGKDGEYDRDGYLGALISLKGKQVYALPKIWDPKKWDQVYIWCEVAGVPLGVADLK